jgi:hypothetical protein
LTSGLNLLYFSQARLNEIQGLKMLKSILPLYKFKFSQKSLSILFIIFTNIILLASSGFTADVISNGNFSSGTTDWTHVDVALTTTMSSDGTLGNPSPSLKGLTGEGDNEDYEFYHEQTISTTINSTDSVFLSFWVRREAISSATGASYTTRVDIKKPSGGVVTLWEVTAINFAQAGVGYTDQVTDSLVSSHFDESGTYDIRLYSILGIANINPKRDPLASAQVNWDNIVLDVRTPAVNQPPVVTDIPNQSVSEGSTFTTITLDDYVSDPDNTDAQMTWSYSGNTELTVDITSRVATITIPDINWNGSEVITFRATDPGLEFSEDAATFTVTPVNDPPVVTDIPNQSVGEGSSFTTITLDDYVSDVDNTDAEMTWTYSGNTELTVDITSRVATITPPDADWNGSEVITFRATDPGLEFSEDAATFTITPINDPPVVTDIPNQSVGEGSTFTTITLDDYVSDVDNTDAEMTWTYSGNTELTVDITSRVATITIPDINWNGSEVITFRATDPGLEFSEDAATFTITPINDPPTLVDSVTAVSLSPVNRAGGVTTDITAFNRINTCGQST